MIAISLSGMDELLCGLLQKVGDGFLKKQDQPRDVAGSADVPLLKQLSGGDAVANLVQRFVRQLTDF